MVHIKKGNAMDKFPNAVIDCTGKGVLYYTILPTGQDPRTTNEKGGQVPQQHQPDTGCALVLTSVQRQQSAKNAQWHW